jgi:hypothetical protein
MNKIHINRNVIASNSKNSQREPPIAVRRHPNNRKTPKSVDYGSKVEIVDDAGRVVASVVYSPDKPLNCGAKVWIETELEVSVKK